MARLVATPFPLPSGCRTSPGTESGADHGTRFLAARPRRARDLERDHASPPRPLRPRRDERPDDHATDYVVCFLDDIYTPVERTLIEAGREDAVQQTRNVFQDAMRPNFVEAVERATGRHVIAFMSQVHFDPDMAAEIFVLEPEDGDRAVNSEDGDRAAQPV
ncbi:MAG: Na-translocating system protein MpsC family protein [Gaiellaceae bacterium]